MRLLCFLVLLLGPYWALAESLCKNKLSFLETNDDFLYLFISDDFGYTHELDLSYERICPDSLSWRVGVNAALYTLVEFNRNPPDGFDRSIYLWDWTSLDFDVKKNYNRASSYTEQSLNFGLSLGFGSNNRGLGYLQQKFFHAFINLFFEPPIYEYLYGSEINYFVDLRLRYDLKLYLTDPIESKRNFKILLSPQFTFSNLSVRNELLVSFGVSWGDENLDIRIMNHLKLYIDDLYSNDIELGLAYKWSSWAVYFSFLERIEPPFERNRYDDNEPVFKFGFSYYY